MSLQSYNLPPLLDKEIDELEHLITEYQQGRVSSLELKAHRVPFGVYEQRQAGTYMMRIRCPAGVITPLQLQKIAEVAESHGLNQLHITTRQEIQIHQVRLENLIPIMRSLKEVGLSSRGGGGNTVRNIIAQEDAGIDPDEVFDVTPYAIALTSKLIEEDDSWTLPRKFKIAFSGSAADKGYASLADVGFIATMNNSEKGFRVYAAGGMGAKSSVGNLLWDFIPIAETYRVVSALKRLFWKYGNRKNKHAARLRFLWQSLGQEQFRSKFNEEYEAVKKEKGPLPAPADIDNNGLEPEIALPEIENKQDFELWQKRFVTAQKQKGLYSILIPIELGFITTDKARALAVFLNPFGDNVLRLTRNQNMLLRNIRQKYLGSFYHFLKAEFENFNRPLIYDSLICCAGASTCQLGICLSRGAARAIMRAFSEYDLALDDLSGLKINISGCPNACGQHPAADIGFFGKASRREGKLYPAYNVVAGAVIHDQKTRLAEMVAEVSSRDLPRFLAELLREWLIKKEKYKLFSEYFNQEGRLYLAELGKKYSLVPTFSQDKNYYYDWEADSEFSLAGRGAGECSAGIFDLIDIDFKNIAQTKAKLLQDANSQDKAKFLLQLVFYACRALLITRGLEPKTKAEVYEGFEQHFIARGLVDAGFKEVVALAKDNQRQKLLSLEEKIYALVDRVKFLYENMDKAFNFQAETKLFLSEKRQKMVKDLRGVACPMNFAKTKVELAKLKSNDLLELWLDDGEPIENVPGSLRAEGHKIISQEKIGNYWKVVIEKN